MKQWSGFQQAIFENVRNGSGNTAVISRAGVGKTTVLVECLRHIPSRKKVLIAAFSKAIVEELKERVSDTHDLATLHSLGFRAIRLRFGNVKLDTYKCPRIIEELVGEKNYELVQEIARTVSLCKSTLTDTPTKILDLMDKYGIECLSYEREEFAKLVIKVLSECKKQTAIVDYDDMIYFPYVFNLSIGKYDYIMIDEAQDMSYAQLILALSAIREGSRVFIFLDDRQAIFGFRGCDIESVRTILDKLKPTKLSLPISYRCPKRVVYMAQEIVPDIRHTDNAADGIIEDIKLSKVLETVKKGDYIISRTNAPLVKLCYALLKNGVPANIQGRDIGANLTALIKKSKAKTIEGFLKFLDKWKTGEIKRLSAERKDVSLCLDKAETLSNLCEGCSSIQDLKNNIVKLFDDVEDEKGKVLLGSTHRLKGKEANRVFMLSWTYRKGASEEEDNLYYTAITRSKRELFLVSK